MNVVSLRLFACILVGLVLTACEPQESVPAQTTDSASDQAAEEAPRTGVASVDKDGNIAPFGFASKQPVEVAEPMPAAPPTPTSADSGLYAVHCVACHGPDANGVEGLGVNLRISELVGKSSDMELIAFLKVGRAAGAPDNVSGVPMPAFGYLPDSDLESVVTYLKSFNLEPAR